jgi:hypothetical protein
MLTVVIRGNTDFRTALRRFAPDLEKALTKEMRRGLKPIVAKAKGYVPAESPMSGWAARSFSEGKFPMWNSSTVKRGITYSTSVSKHTKSGFTSNARIMNNSAVGAIYETAGRKNPAGQPWVGANGGSSHNVSHSVNKDAGRQFISNLGALTFSSKGLGRLIYRAWAEDQGVATGIVLKAISDTKIAFYKRSQLTAFSTITKSKKAA